MPDLGAVADDGARVHACGFMYENRLAVHNRFPLKINLLPWGAECFCVAPPGRLARTSQAWYASGLPL
jgi:hypothetical protein